MNLINARLIREYPVSNTGWIARISPLRRSRQDRAAGASTVLMGAVVFSALDRVR